MLSLGTPTEIDGQEVIVVADVLAIGEPDDGYVRIGTAPDGDNGIWLDEAELARLRESSPDIQVYGFWQLVFASRLFEIGQVTQLALLLDENSGFYLDAEDGLIRQSGQYRGKEIIDLDVDVDDIEQIGIQPERLTLAVSPARLPNEIGAETRRRQRAQAIRLGAIAALGIVICVGFKVMSGRTVAQRETTLARVQQTQQGLSRDISALREIKQAEGVAPAHQALVINRLLELVYRAQFIELSETSFDSDEWVVRMDDDTVLPAWTKDVSVVPEPTSTVTLTWSLEDL